MGGGGINSGLGFGAEPNPSMVKAMLNEYDEISFVIDDNNFDLTPCPIRNTKAFEKHGYVSSDDIVCIDGAYVLPNDYLAPKNYLTREIKITQNTVSIHHYDGSWMLGKSRLSLKVKEILGPQINKFLYKLRGIRIE